MMADACKSLRKWRQEDHEFEASPGKVTKPLSQKQNKNKRARGTILMVENFPSMCKMCKVLGSIPGTT
jgi:hypothetical protein